MKLFSEKNQENTNLNRKLEINIFLWKKVYPENYFVTNIF